MTAKALGFRGFCVLNAVFACLALICTCLALLSRAVGTEESE